MIIAGTEDVRRPGGQRFPSTFSSTMRPEADDVP